MRLSKIALIALAMLLLAACAPEDLDITPTVTPSNTPLPTETRAPTRTPAPEATPEPEEEEEPAAATLLDTIVAGLPASISVGGASWQVNPASAQFRDTDGGRLVTVSVAERQGGQITLYFGEFESVEGAVAYFENTLRTVRNLENASQRPDFPEPNGFNVGLYGSESIWMRENLVVRVRVDVFNSGGGNPLVGMSQQIQNILNGIEGVPASA
ncbi:hypothetical protein FBR02_04030 [Anaerolineae bacterium CFX9]|nr:hypothetical protein [Anaerolineae bacterium CFX9]